jgi:hypothetical protein
MNFPETVKNYAECLFLASACEVDIEDWLDDNCIQFGKISCDYHDGSIEIYLGPEANDVPVDQKVIEKCKEWGFTCGWINYTNQKEEHFNCHRMSRDGIKLRSHKSWWNEETCKEYI